MPGTLLSTCVCEFISFLQQAYEVGTFTILVILTKDLRHIKVK